MHRLQIALLITVLLPAAQAAGAEPASDLARLTGALERIADRHDIPVLAVSIAKDGAALQSIVLGGSASTPLRWGSITKTFTAVTVLTLAEAGLLSLDAPLHRYVPSDAWRNPWRRAAPVRVIDLLELRAGFTDLSAMEFEFNQPITLEEALRLNPGYRVTRWPPGLQHGYSNLSPGLTQLLIETVGGSPYAEVVARRVFAPLGLRDSGFAPRADLPGGFRADGATAIPYWHMTFPAYGALNAPLADMNLFMRGALDRTGLPPGVWSRLFSPSGRRLAADFRFDYAAGFYPRVRRGFVWHGHGGDADGYRSRIALLEGYRRGYAVNINVDNPRLLRRIEQLLEEYLTADLTPSRPVAPPAQVELQAWVGEYYPASARFGLSGWQAGDGQAASVTAHGDHLKFHKGTRTTRLNPVTRTQFRREADPVATVVFVRDAAQLYLQGELGNWVRTDHCPPYLRALPQCSGK